MRLDLRYIDLGITFALVTGVYSAASRSAHQPAGCTGWIELYPLRPHAAGRLRPVEITLIFDIELLTIN